MAWYLNVGGGHRQKDFRKPFNDDGTPNYIDVDTGEVFEAAEGIEHKFVNKFVRFDQTAESLYKVLRSEMEIPEATRIQILESLTPELRDELLASVGDFDKLTLVTAISRFSPGSLRDRLKKLGTDYVTNTLQSLGDKLQLLKPELQEVLLEFVTAPESETAKG